MRRYKAVVDATVKLTVWIKEYENGEMEIDEADEVLEVIEFENVKEFS